MKQRVGDIRRFGGVMGGSPWRVTDSDLAVGDGRYDYGLSQPETGATMTCEFDIDIPVRDGVTLKGDLYRPQSGAVPVIANFAPYPRRGPINLGLDDTGGVGVEYQWFEQPNPEYWIPRGYAYLTVSGRGFSGSAGQPAAFNTQEGEDFYDCIEWAAEQSWCDGNVGLLGISYYAFSQYRVAALKPPHLRAIVPWEGLNDPYREAAYRGGIPGFFGRTMAFMIDNMKTAKFRGFSHKHLVGDHSLIDDDLDDVQTVGLENITVPMLSVGNLNDPDLHLRGNVEAFLASPGPHKKMLLYSGTHWGSAYQPWAHRTVLRFFDHWLKGRDTGIYDEPAIDVELRTGPGSFRHVYGDQWPLPQTQWTRLHLDAADCSLSETPADVAAAVKADWKFDEGVSRRVSFTTPPLPVDVAIAGHVAAHLWVSSSTDDADLIVELRDLDEAGNETRFAFIHHDARDEPITRGWLRASHRELDPDKTLPYRPYHSHRRRAPLVPGEPVELDVEIWPTSMVFKAGHRIQLTIHTGLYLRRGEAKTHKTRFGGRVQLVNSYQDLSTNRSVTTFHTGPNHPAWLQLPVIPASPNLEHQVAIVDGGYAPEWPGTARSPQFSPAGITAALGDTVSWSNVSAGYHTSTESVLSLWDSQLIRGTRSRNPATWGTTMAWAGTFEYRDEIDGAGGVVSVPPGLHLDPATRDVVVTLALAPLACKATGRVQFRVRPSGGEIADDTWEAIETSELECVITTAGGGTLDVRVQWTNGDSLTPWSPVATIDLP
ncbi:CocE/NonD family hydrolase [Nocardia nova]|uniref:CocE/NonD family hydrolase n=1 Tax=Nocardia nova TaxID=37330 RepID=UPI0033EA26EA